MTARAATQDKIIVFFDGECAFCIGWVNFIIDRDSADRFRFAALQGDWARRFFVAEKLVHPGMDSMVVWKDGKLLLRSDAALAIAASLPRPLRWAEGFVIIPRNWRDCAYNFIARRRHKWPFRRSGACRLPSADMRAKLLQ